MYHQVNHLSKFWLIAAIVSATFTACKRDEVINTAHNAFVTQTNSSGDNSLETSGNSPAAHIAASENLDIPAAGRCSGKFTQWKYKSCYLLCSRRAKV